MSVSDIINMVIVTIAFLAYAEGYVSFEDTMVILVFIGVFVIVDARMDLRED